MIEVHDDSVMLALSPNRKLVCTHLEALTLLRDLEEQKGRIEKADKLYGCCHVVPYEGKQAVCLAFPSGGGQVLAGLYGPDSNPKAAQELLVSWVRQWIKYAAAND